MTAAERIAPLIAELDSMAELDTVLSLAFARRAALAQCADASGDDELIDVEAAATMLGVSASYLYHGRKLPFAVRVGARRMFSRRGIQKFIARQQGKA